MKTLKYSLLLSLLCIAPLLASENEWKCFYEKDGNNRYIEVYAKSEREAKEKVAERLNMKVNNLTPNILKCYKEEEFEDD
jgi:hypothetical protein